MFVALPSAVAARTSGDAVLNLSQNHFFPDAAALHVQDVAVCPLLWVL